MAENRGKTLYCGIDQSDTFTKAETWAAGRDRNERDDTVYFGENGNFRGFIAAQEGWLTDGESGITGQSTATIFEFPKPQRRVTRTKRIKVGSGPAETDTCPATDLDFTVPTFGRAWAQSAADARPGTLICSAFGPSTNSFGNASTGQRNSRQSYASKSVSTGWTINWRTNAGNDATNPPDWRALAANAARSACKARGYKYAAGSADFAEGHSRNRGAGNADHGSNLGWFYAFSEHQSSPGNYQHRARESRTWSATCVKKVRRTRR